MSCTQSPGDTTIPVCLGVGHLRVEQGWYHTAHSHGFHQIMVMAGGCLAVMAGEAQVQAQPGDVLCYPSGVRHAERAADPGGAEFTYLAFQAHLEPCPSVVQDPTGRGLALARWLHEEQSAGRPRRQQVMDGLLNLLLEVHARAVAGGPPAFVERARRTMREQLAAPLRLSDLAMGAAMSPGAFGRLYRRASGMTPMADLRRLRLEAARDLIEGTGLPLKAIAERTGFCDQYHLGRCFRRCFRVPPGFFRRRSWPR